MNTVQLEGCNLMISSVVPHDHPLTGAGFPLWSDVRRPPNAGKTTIEEWFRDKDAFYLGELDGDLLDSGRVVSWIALKPGKKNHRLQIFYANGEEKEALEMEEAVEDAVNEILYSTWAYGQAQVLHNTEAPDLIAISVVGHQGERQYKHFMDMKGGQIGVWKAKDANAA